MCFADGVQKDFKESISQTCSLLQYCIRSICDSTSISRIQRPLKACFRLLHDDDDDDVSIEMYLADDPLCRIYWLH